MNNSEFIEFWNGNLIKIPDQYVVNSELPKTTKEFLVHVGIPAFNASKALDMLGIRFRVDRVANQTGNYLVIGEFFDAAGQADLALEQNTGHLYLINLLGRE